MCDKIFYENPTISRRELTKNLKELFEADSLFFIPWDRENDIIGHADGMLRFIDNDTVIINDYSIENPEYSKAFLSVLKIANLKFETIPYNPYINKKKIEANGIYINYLQMQDKILFATFGKKEDEIALKKISSIFPKFRIETIDCNEIALQGGVLNCISWNIKS